MKDAHTCKILLADDDAEDRLLFKEALEETKDADLVIANDGLDLMTKLASMVELPDAIFLDLNMPRKDGHQCLREIRKDAKLKSIPVIIYSTTKNKTQIDATYSEGASLFITKPDSFTKLKQILQKMHAMKTNFRNIPDRKNFVFSV